MESKKALIWLAALALGILVPMEINAIRGASEGFSRENESNFFKEIRILKEKNDDLRSEVSDLEETLANLKDQNFALEEIEDELTKYMKLSGDYPIFGPGIQLTIQRNIGTNWLIDTINELFNAGAQAVSINDIRIDQANSGFDTLPKGDPVINGQILTTPFVINAIGEAQTLSDVITLPGGIVSRLKAAYPGIKIDLSKKDVLAIE